MKYQVEMIQKLIFIVDGNNEEQIQDFLCCNTIEEIKQKAIPIAQEYGVDSMSLFGSYARGEASEDSDLDFFIDRGDIKGLLDTIIYSFDS